MKKYENFRVWFQKTLPTLYNDALTYEEMLYYLNQITMDNSNDIKIIQDYLNTLDVQEAVNNKLDEMASSGELANIIDEYLKFNYLIVFPNYEVAYNSDYINDGKYIRLLNITNTDNLGGIYLITSETSTANGFDVLQFKNNLYGIRQPLEYSKKINLFQNKNIFFFGDSWVVGGSAGAPEKRFSTLLANKLQMKEYNYGVGGAGFTLSSNQIITQIQNLTLPYTDYQNTGIVLLFGGVNDWRNNSSITPNNFATNIVNTCNAAHAKFPNALIVLCTSNTELNIMSDTFRHWVYNARITATEQCNFPLLIIDNFENALMTQSKYYQPDNLHLTTLGHSRLAGFLSNAILGGSTQVNEYIGLINFNSSVKTNVLPHLYQCNQYIVSTPMTITLATPINANTQIGSIPSSCYPKTNIYEPIYHANQIAGCLAITTSGSVRVIPMNSLTSFYSNGFSYICGIN